MKKLMSAEVERIKDFGKWSKKKGEEKLATVSGDGVTQAQDMMWILFHNPNCWI